MSYDTIVIGAGLNGLTAATTLARGGHKVLVLEARSIVGGLAAGDEFHPGYRSPGIFLDTRWLRPSVISSLGLERHGLKVRTEPADVVLLGDGEHSLVLGGTTETTAKAIAELSPEDAEKYSESQAYLDTIAPVLRSFFNMQPVDIVNIESEKKLQLLWRALDIRRLGRKHMLELLRLPPMPVADYLNEHFETPLLKAGLALPALASTFTGPRSPGSCTSYLLSSCTAEPGVDGTPSDVIGAVLAAAEEAGVEVRTDARVSQIDLADDVVDGVTLDSGDSIAAKRVFSALDPKTTLATLVPDGALPYTTENRTDNFRSIGTTGHLLLAVDDDVRFEAAASAKHARIAPSLDYIEQAFDAVKYGEASAKPAMEVVLAPHLAPEGATVVAAKLHYVPYELKGGWTDEKRAQLADRAIEMLTHHLPGMSGKILERRILVPQDIETEYGITGGHLYHGEHGLDQLLVRPMPECVGYRTPIPGLHLCSGGSHPGGWFSGAPGLLAAKSVLV
jgi:phytoene dehydrogenase-like protein